MLLASRRLPTYELHAESGKTILWMCSRRLLRSCWKLSTELRRQTQISLWLDAHCVPSQPDSIVIRPVVTELDVWVGLETGYNRCSPNLTASCNHKRMWSIKPKENYARRVQFRIGHGYVSIAVLPITLLSTINPKYWERFYHGKSFKNF